MDALEALTTRRSIRSYTSQPVDHALIETIVDAGRLATTARNVQPWQFVAVTNREMLDQLAETSDYADFLRAATACILVFCEAEAKYYLEDGCAAMENMLIAAHALGLGTCWIAGDKKPYIGKIAEMLGVPKKYCLVAYCALGHPKEPRPTPPSKKPLEDVLHWERFGSAASM